MYGVGCVALSTLITAARSNADAAAALQKDQPTDCSAAGIEAPAMTAALLGAWKDGQDGRGNWVFGLETEKLYAVWDYKLLRSGRTTPSLDANGEPTVESLTPDKYGYVCRVSSSTKGGFPVTKDWLLTVLPTGKTCKVAALEEWQ